MFEVRNHHDGVAHRDTEEGNKAHQRTDGQAGLTGVRALRILGLPPGSSADEIKMAWRDLAKVWHPDRFAHDERLRAKAGDNLSRINQAHEALADYDPAAVPTMTARMRQLGLFSRHR